jgi:Plant transposon protein
MGVICDGSLWIWHAFFGCPGFYNDINILNCSPLFSDVLAGNFLQLHLRFISKVLSSNGSIGSSSESIRDGVALFRHFETQKNRIKNIIDDRQDAVRNSVERVFGVLCKRFNILYQPSRLHYVATMRSVVLACVILDNMIVEVRRDGYAGVSGDSFSFEPSGATSIRTISKARTVQERVSQWQAVSQVESPVLHKELQLALMRYISKAKTEIVLESL